MYIVFNDTILFLPVLEAKINNKAGKRDNKNRNT
jgi:hypothetical protein